MAKETGLTSGIERKYMILKSLTAGIALGPYLYDKFFKRADGKKIAVSYFWRVMEELRKGEYIQKRHYSRIKMGRKKGIYAFALSDLGVNEVCNSFNIERDHIRRGLPRADHLMHELEVSEAIRVIWREVEEKKYDIDHIYDDRMMKRLAPPRKGMYYPDLRVEVLPKYKDKMTFNIEIDSGTKGRIYWTNKLLSWKDDTLVLTLHRGRQDRLFRYMKGISHRVKFVAGFAIANDFNLKGLSGTEWLWLHDGKKAKIGLL